ncbi:MAG: hypothetical protein JWM82_3051 [Myxococcales bacterium]|nr:hypothetical protein [Myxococcales bacterium]
MTNPFEPPRSTDVATGPRAAGRPDACQTCGTGLSAENTLYDDRGDVTCQRCLMERQAAQGHARVANKVKNVAKLGPVLGLAAFVFNPLLVTSAAAIFNGVYVLRAVRDKENAKLLVDKLGMMKTAAIAGIALGGLAVALRVFIFVLGGVR